MLKGSSAVTETLVESEDTETLSPKLPVLPSTLMRSCKNFVNVAIRITLSVTGKVQSTVNVTRPDFLFTRGMMIKCIRELMFLK